MVGMPSRPGMRRHLVVMLAVVGLAGGCDDGDSPPPPLPPAGVSQGADSLLPPPPLMLGGSPQIEFILPMKLDPIQSTWEAAARRQAAASNVLFETKQPTKLGVATQEELVRAAVGRGVSAIVLVPGREDRGDLISALEEARSRKVPVIILGERVEVGSEVMPQVARADYLPQARKLVEALVEDAKLVGREPKGPALVLVNETASDHAQRTEAVLTALGEYGVEVLDGAPKTFVVQYSEAMSIVEKAAREHPKLPMVIVTDDVGFRAATTVRNQITPGERFVFGGFTADPKQSEVVGRSFASAIVDCKEGALGRTAVDQILKTLRGEPLPKAIEVTSTFMRAPGLPSMDYMSVDAMIRSSGKEEGPADLSAAAAEEKKGREEKEEEP